MYREFGITKISTSLSEKKIFIEFTLDIDPESTTLDTLSLSEKTSNRLVAFDINVNRNVVVLELHDWPVIQEEYLLRVHGGIMSIVEDKLPDSLQRHIVFSSEITSAVEIISPSDHEEIEKLSLAWREVPADEFSEELVFSYYIEVAKENAFYNIVKKTTVVEKQSISLSDIEPGQYYARIRAQKGNAYGKWSDIITFIVIEPSVQINVEEDDVIFEDELLIVTTPENGETPETFVIEFDEDIDVDSVYEVTVTRRPI